MVLVDGHASGRRDGTLAAGEGAGDVVASPDILFTGTTNGFEVLADFHPAVRTWFERRFTDGPTEPQVAGWPAIGRGEHTLIASPTGSGKTLAGFLSAIDALYRAHARGREIGGATQVVYVSPLKALAVDVGFNLEAPLAEIADVARELGLEPAPITLGIRSGDTPASTRQAMVKNPPNFLITTPESLYLYLTAEKSRNTLTAVETVIVDEIHTMARDKRGSHLTLSLERLDHVAANPPVRVGLSATQRPISTVARLLVGAGDDRTDPNGEPACTVVDVGHRRKLDISLELPEGELEAATSGEQMAEILDLIAAHVADHRTTLVFVNTRRLSERVARDLAERLGDDAVSAHHGSLSRERRYLVESKLRAGELRALVATASLELGIDVGPVELVCQVGSPRNIATFLQRVGRANHHRSGIPKGILYPTTRDELVECAALLGAVRDGRLDELRPPVAPLDVLVQQIVAEVAAAADEGWSEEALFRRLRRAAPYAELPRERFDEALDLVSEGIITGRGRRMAYLHRDRVNGQLRARRGARLAALTSGGAIPESGDYRVVMEPGDTFVGTINEDFAIESMQGDVFLLGTHPWRILQVTNGVVRVADASGERPTVPFWLGEAPGRTAELSREVSDLRSVVDRLLAVSRLAEAVEAVMERCGIDDVAAAMIVDYLAAARAALGGVMPTLDDIVFERFFDETGGMQLIIHAPFGARLNRALGFALRKKFCVSFDFELQAAASDDAVLLSLGPQHSFPLDEVPRFLKSEGVEAVVTQAVLQSPMFQARWRWNLNRSLAVLRRRGGKINPFNIQRMEANDLMAAVFPSLAACQDNAPAGPIEIPDHLLVRETMHDCLHEGMDIDGLRDLLVKFEQGGVELHFLDTVEASPLAHEILNGAPYTYLDDDNEIGERRSRAVVLPRGLPVEARELGRLEPEAIARVRAEAEPDVRDPEELHDVLLSAIALRPRDAWADWFGKLRDTGRASEVHIPTSVAAGAPTSRARRVSGSQDHHRAALVVRWVATERLDEISLLYPGATVAPDHAVPEALRRADVTEDSARVAVVRGLLDISGPLTISGIVEETAIGEPAVMYALETLRAEGFTVAGDFDPALGGDPGQQWCARRLLARIHSYTRARKRAQIQAVTKEDWLTFIDRWWFEADGTQRTGRHGLGEVIEQLQGFEWPAGEWEQVFARRVQAYRPEWLDDLCLSGEVVWGRLSILEAAEDPDDPAAGDSVRSGKSPSRRTPITFMLRDDLSWLLQALRGDDVPAEPTAGSARDVLDALHQRGALFHGELQTETGRLPTEVEEGLWDGVARGLVTSDGFNAVRTLFDARHRFARRQRSRPGSRGKRGTWRHGVEGRWSLMPPARPIDDRDDLAEHVAWQLLTRWGVVFRDLYRNERFSLPWREVQWALRRLEARGQIRGGHFVTGVTGEQYALEEAWAALRRVRTDHQRQQDALVS
ncbi:MAG TPA: DEAD/DEAH box helicase [Acidimicrobiales bacterium]